MIAQKIPADCVPARIRLLDKNPVICGAQQVSGAAFLVICTNKLLIETAKKHSNVLWNTFNLKDNYKLKVYPCTVMTYQIKEPFGFSITWCLSLFICLYGKLQHVCTRPGEESTRSAETMSHVVLIHAFLRGVVGGRLCTMGQCCVLEMNFFVQSVNQPEIKEQNGITKSGKMR